MKYRAFAGQYRLTVYRLRRMSTDLTGNESFLPSSHSDCTLTQPENALLHALSLRESRVFLTYT